MSTTYCDGPYRTFTERVAGALDGKEATLVEIHTDGTLQAATAGKAIGVMMGKLQAGATDVNVRMLGKGGTVRIMQKAAITPGARVKQDPANPTEIIAATGAECLGIKLGSAAGADGDIVEIQDLFSAPGAATSVAAQTTSATVINALTFSAQATQAEANALKAECAKNAGDIKVLRDAMIASGVFVSA